VKSDLHSVNEALQRRGQNIALARQDKSVVLKIVHGYGSSGVGGDIRVALHSPARLLAFGLVFALVPWLTNSQATGQAPVDDTVPVARLVNTCLITANVDRLVQFYEPILGLKPHRSGKDYAEFHTGAGVLAVYSAAAQEKYISGSVEAAKNRSVILEFRVMMSTRNIADFRVSSKPGSNHRPHSPGVHVPFTSGTLMEISWIFIRRRNRDHDNIG
jgi:hypothetical protein